MMSSGDLLNIHPTELKFPFELRTQSTCTIQLSNRSTNVVAFKVKTTNPKKYSVRPNTGLVLPNDSCSVTVTMQAQRETPIDMQCRDKFLVQSVIVQDGTVTTASANKLLSQMFAKVDGRVVEEMKLRVVYIPANPPSPVPEGSEEGNNSPRASLNDIASQTSSLVDDGDWSMISKLTGEKTFATQQNQELRQELEILRKKSSTKQSREYSLVLMVLVGLLSCLIGYSFGG